MNIHPTARIEVDELVLGEGATVRAHAEIYGKRVVLGREAFIDEYAVIGGGSAESGELVAGDWFHLGMYAQVNIARDVHVGDEVGIGIGSRVFTHGAYLSEYDGFPADFGPVTIGSRVWLPQATVLPCVTIGDDVVVAAGSVVTHDLPAGCLATGCPAEVRVKNRFPRKLDDQQRQRVLDRICEEAGCGDPLIDVIDVGDTRFDVALRTVRGPVTSDSERLRNQLRRHGIRFRYEPRDGQYVAWQ